MFRPFKMYLFVVTLLFSIQLSAQVKFKPGYYITNQNEKITCFIKDIDWLKNPTDFEYKLTENTTTSKIGIQQVKEFAIDDGYTFVRKKVKMDRSTSNVRNLSTVKDPKFSEEVLFLKRIVMGEASLYKYNETNFERFFYSTENTPEVEQLVFKKYQTGNQVGENNFFRRQLWISVRCPDQKNAMNLIEKLDYYEDELAGYFEEYNSCVGRSNSNITGTSGEATNQKIKKRSGKFNLSVRPGVYSARLSFENVRNVEVDFDHKFGFRIGAEFEYVFPFNNNKWSLFFEPTFQSYSNEEMASEILTATVDYTSIELPIGVRYYSFLNDQNKLFFNLGLLVDIPQKDGIDFNFNDDPGLANDNNLFFGIGYEYDSKFNLELRYGTNRDFLASGIWRANFTSISIIAGYKILLN